MGLRFRKSFGLLPGIKINLSKTGPSLSVGGKGLSANFGPKGKRATIGLPGSGLSYSTSTQKSGAWIFAVALLALAYYYLQHPDTVQNFLTHFTEAP